MKHDMLKDILSKLLSKDGKSSLKDRLKKNGSIKIIEIKPLDDEEMAEGPRIMARLLKKAKQKKGK